MTSSSIASENQRAASVFSTTERFTATLTAPQRTGTLLPWAIAMILVGLATVAFCVLVPLREDNRRLAHEMAGVAAEADYVQRQVAANAAFLDKVHTDPALAERLAMRATRRPAAGKQFLEDAPAATFGASPYAITQVAPPAPQAEYRTDLPPVLAGLLLDNRSRGILLAAGLFLVGAAVILGKSAEPRIITAR